MTPLDPQEVALGIKEFLEAKKVYESITNSFIMQGTEQPVSPTMVGDVGEYNRFCSEMNEWVEARSLINDRLQKTRSAFNLAENTIIRLLPKNIWFKYHGLAVAITQYGAMNQVVVAEWVEGLPTPFECLSREENL